MTDLVGKKKYIINSEIWGAPSQNSANVPIFQDSNHEVTVGGSPIGMTFLSYDNKGYVGKDNLRIALGANWNTAAENSDDQTSPVTTTNDWPALSLFYGQPLGIKYCFTGQDHELEYPGFFSENQVEANSEAYLPLISDPLFYKAIWKEKIVVSASVPKGPMADLDDGAATNPELNKHKRPNFELWAGFIKCGVSSQGRLYKPIIRNPGTTIESSVYRDHFHESVSPFTPKELLSKQPFGKSAFADVRTYYKSTSAATSDTLSSNLSYEKFIGMLADPENINTGIVQGNAASYNTIMPTPYAFLRLMSNKFEIEDLYDFERIDKGDAFPTPFTTVGDMYKHFPLEVLITYFSRVPNETISKFMKSSFKNQDLSAFMDEYFIRWQNAHTSINSLPDPNNTIKNARALGLSFLDQRMSNIVLSPYVYKQLDKVESIKKYFPFYCELEFSTSTFTEIGDMIKKMLFTNFFVNKIAEINTRHIADPSELATTHAPALQPHFYDHYSDGYYKNIKSDDGESTTSELMFSTGPTSGPISQLSRKKTYDLISTLTSYLEDPDYYSGYDQSGYHLDIQDYVTYVRNDLDEPLNVSEFNQAWKLVLGQLLKNKLLNTYKKHHRSFQDLIEGKPAYHETIAYKIEKYERNPGSQPIEQDLDDDGLSDSYTPVQSFIIPNTTDLNVFNYIDTQVRYGDTKIYKYRVYAMKVVFGCSYRYIFHDDQEWHPIDATNSEEIQNDNVYQDLSAAPDNQKGEPQLYNATVGVEILPSIVMMQDLYFETPDVIISDNPPVVPDVNIVPYRAVNDKVLIMLNSMVDSYRQEPIPILDTDIEKFDFNKKAQLSPDGKILFASDDTVKKFEIFRTDKKPYSYRDFERIELTSKSHYIDQIMPNKRYWYTFRAIDSHNHISNPTAVFEVELVDDHGAVRPMIRIFNFEEPKYSQAIKECQKYLMIKPTLEQIYYDGKKDIDHMFNNQDDETKRRFKIRLTSKSTGRKIDFNVAFNKKAVT